MPAAAAAIAKSLWRPFNGDRVDELSPSARNISMVFQNYALYPHLSVRDNLAYPLKKRRLPPAERTVQVDDVAARLHIEELLDRKPRQLSGGQQQRVALGRAMIRKPSVFLLDEPLSNLDAQLRVVMRGELVGLHKMLGQTMIYVTHDQLEAMTMSDRIAVMSQGRLQQVGTPTVIYQAPANRFVAMFVGSPAMNFLSGEIAGTPDPMLRIAGQELPIDQGQIVHAGPVDIGVRAEDVLVGDGPLLGQVRIIEHTGHENLVSLTTPLGNLTTRLGSSMPVAVGNSMPFRLRNLHLFDAATGVRLN
jgi:multiple sugar transport system ATP-binding protein